jgi:hypothetical protein
VSWQAFQAIRDHSESRGAKRTVGFVLASHADKRGDNVRPGLDKICAGAKVTRKTAVDARRWFVEHGEAEIVGYWPSRTPNPIPILSFAPLIAKGSPSELARLAEQTLKGSLDAGKGSLAPAKGSLGQPEPKGKRQTESEDETKAASRLSSHEEEERQVATRGLWRELIGGSSKDPAKLARSIARSEAAR